MFLAAVCPCQVSQTKDLARFHTPEVLRLQQDLLRARESRDIAARQAWAKLVSQVPDPPPPLDRSSARYDCCIERKVQSKVQW